MGKIASGKNRISMNRLCLLFLSAACAVCVAGCGESKAAKEARLAGIRDMEAEQYEQALASFQEALDASDGIVDEFELDILKYRGEAEYRLGDYRAAAHTYDILAEVDEGKAEYRYCKAMAEAQAGNPEAASEDYGKARELDMQEETELPMTAAIAVAEAYRNAGMASEVADFCQEILDSGMWLAFLY